jgi:3-methyladenine DNA glycosylase Mpg
MRGAGHATAGSTSTSRTSDLGGLGGVIPEELRASKLDRSFFLREARVVARALVGTYLVHAPRGKPARAARIVETEAYLGPKDLASHARAGLTRRTKTLFGPPGHAYVFLIYGMYD